MSKVKKTKVSVSNDSCVKNGEEKGSSFDCRTAVYEGKIERFPLMTANGSIDDTKTINLKYIKLSANRSWLDNPDGHSLADKCYGLIVREWYEEKKDPEFPHYPTKEQEWTEKQFLAYVSLGEHHVRNYLNRETPSLRICTPKPERVPGLVEN